jgi:hypothetical protein
MTTPRLNDRQRRLLTVGGLSALGFLVPSLIVACLVILFLGHRAVNAIFQPILFATGALGVGSGGGSGGWIFTLDSQLSTVDFFQCGCGEWFARAGQDSGGTGVNSGGAGDWSGIT